MLETGLPLAKAQKLLATELATLDPSVLAQLHSVCATAERFGGALAPAIETLRRHQNISTELKREINLASKSPRFTARLIGLMPVGALFTAQLLGLNIARAATHQPVILISLLLGALLMRANSRFAQSRIKKLEADVSATLDANAGIGEMLVQLEAGAPIERVAVLAQQNARVHDPAWRNIEGLLAFAAAQGMAASAPLKSYARNLHQSAAFELRLRISTFQAKLVAPLALSMLPVLAFLAIIPATMTLITN